MKPKEAAELCESAIKEYLGEGASSRFQAKRQKIRDKMKRIRDRTGLTKINIAEMPTPILVAAAATTASVFLLRRRRM